MRVQHLFLIVDALLLGSVWLLFDRNDAAAYAVLAFGGLLAVWQMIVGSSVFPRSTFRIESRFRKPHFVQAALQLCIYFYWGIYWNEPSRFALFIGTQILFAYSLEILLSLSRRKVWTMGFGPIPIVLSLNLFIWFKDEYFYLQLSMIALTYLAKEFITWNRNGRRTHIFNPSGFSLTIVAIALMSTGSTDMFTTGVDLVESFELPPSFYEVIFLLGLVVQFLFTTTPITFGAVLSHYLLYFAVSWMLGGRAGSFPIDRSVFLAMTLLIPDPATSPKSAKGKFLFGVTYGVAILGIGIGLKYFQQPDYFSKILFIPFLNLLTPFFDRIVASRSSEGETQTAVTNKTKTNIIGIILYTGLFVGIVGSLKETRTTPLGRKWLTPVSVASPEMGKSIFNMMIGKNILPGVYKSFGFVTEISKQELLQKIYRGELSVEELDELFLKSKQPGSDANGQNR
jgi:hypothetical protein